MFAENINSEPLRIALSKGSGSENYLKYGEWLKIADPDIEIIDLINYSPQEAVRILQSCHGLFLTGGSDVHPGRYGKENDSSRCTINPERDTLEFALIEKALDMKMPILGVCRGMQILNVALGGTLIVDIPEDYSKEINHSCPDKFAKCHIVDIMPNTHLHKITGVLRDSVTSAHHQGIEYLAMGLIANAIAEDRTVEGYEWLDGSNKSYILGILWHPERMLDSKLSLPIARDFILQAKKFKNQ
jgi:putative glutamine amidotransferase